MRLNVCCGRKILPDYMNIDIVPTGDAKPDILCNALSVPLPDGCADEVMCIHGFEHFYRWEVDQLAEEWKRLLKSGGILVLELPNLVKCCANIVSGYKKVGKHPDQFGMWGLFGDPRTSNPHMIHRWGWSPETLGDFLSEHGFVEIREEVTQWHLGGRANRDMRIVCKKP
jgi:predicted SAM-dependent methyltransferase